MQKTQKITTNPPEDCTTRWVGETFDEYQIRLFENKNKYGLTCQQIADLLNHESGNDFDESKYRKSFADFNRGRQYERAHSSEYVANRVLALSDFHVPYQ